ncbi:MAG TPA: hypothetical protein VLC48_10270 [Gemmatimonadota bacterium]|nr:hypothetical protein [Gemmatimonadota bacterium]
MDITQLFLTISVPLLLLTALFAAKRLTSWWSLLLVLIFPVIGFLFVLFADVWKGVGESREMLASVTQWSSLFDRATDGLNLTLAATYFVGAVLAYYVTPPLLAVIGAPFGVPPLSLAGFQFLGFLVDAVLFVLVCYLFKKEWQLAVAFGVATMVVDLAIRVIMERVAPQYASPSPWLMGAILTFLRGALLMTALLVATRFRGLKWSSLALGVVAFQLVMHVISSILAESSLEPAYFLADIVTGIVFATLVYVGFCVDFHGRPKSSANAPAAAQA